MNNVHTPRYDVGSRARLVCISRRGRSTGLFPITGTERRQRYRAIGLVLAGERKTIARWQGDIPLRHRSPLCIRFRRRRLSSMLVATLAPLRPICFTRVSPRNRVIRETRCQQGRGQRNVSRAKNSTDLLSLGRILTPVYST